MLSAEYVEDVIATDGTHVVCTGHDYDEGGHVSLENARLIAAAPELLDALKMTRGKLPPYETAVIEEVIAKAESRS